MGDVNRTLIQKGCYGMGMNIEAAYDRVRPLVPVEFNLDGTIGAQASILFVVLHCPEGIANATNVGPFDYAEVSAFVTPSNRSWQGDVAVDRYMLDVRTSLDNVSAWLGSFGLAAEASEFGLENNTVPGSTTTTQRWTVSSPSSSFRETGAQNGNRGDHAVSEIHLWYGNAPIRRINNTYDIQYDQLAQVGPLECSGTSACASIFGGAPGAGLQVGVLNGSQTFFFSPEEFAS